MKNVRLLTFTASLLWCCLGLAAQKPKAVPPQTPPAPPAGEVKVPAAPHEMTAADVEAFLEGFMPMQLERENIAGAVVCIVKDGKVLFARGYGFSDVDKKTPVSVEDSLFRPGSISKLFTWTAVMQLVEQGKLDLDRDVNDYLDFRIPATFPQPITLRHILTHTAGFEETIKELFIPENAKLVPLKQYLQDHMPRRIFPPGTTPAYSNYAATLAGYIVERVSGKAFNDYITENIFKPLEMKHSAFTQPLPQELKPLSSNGYELGSGRPKPFEVLAPAPAGSLSSSAGDIAHFMIAHLQEGKFGSAQILRQETARQMHARQSGFHPEMNGMALGFYEESRNGRRIIGHGGDTLYFHSDLHLVLDSQLGFFVSYNSAGKGEISPRSALWFHFLDRYFPYTPPQPRQSADAAADARSVAGYYITSRRSESNFLKVENPFGEVQVMPEADGTLRVGALKDFNGQLKKWREVGPLFYRSVNGQDHLAFERQNDGTMRMIVNFPAVVYQRATWTNRKPFNNMLLIYSISIVMLTLLLWPVAALVRCHYGWKLNLEPGQGGLHLAIRLVCLSYVVFALLLLTIVSSSDPTTLLSGKLDPLLIVAQIIGVIGAAGTLAVIYAAFSLARGRNLWFWARVFNFLIMLACLGLAWFVIHWNLVNFNLKY